MGTKYTLRSKLITEEWLYAYRFWMQPHPELYGDVKNFPTAVEFIDQYVPSFTDYCGLFVDDELVAIGLLSSDMHIHMLVNVDYKDKYKLVRGIKLGFKYFNDRYRTLYTEFFDHEEKVKKLLKSLGFMLLPKPVHSKGLRAAMKVKGAR